MTRARLSKDVPTSAEPGDSYETKAMYLRGLYRKHRPSSRINEHDKFVIDQHEQAEQWRIVSAEYERLFEDRHPPLNYILQNVWTEERELAGQRYSIHLQTWLNPDGTRAEV